MKRTASIATLGCKTNQHESVVMEEKLRLAGYELVDFSEGADLVVVNTCTVTAATDSQSRNLIRRARRMNIDCRVIVTGCYAQIDPETLRAIPGVAVVLGNEEKQDLLRYLDDEQQAQIVEVSDIRSGGDSVPLTLSAFTERSRAFVQIQNGCDAFCSYCIIPYARGTSRSMPPEQVIQQVLSLQQQGYPEVVFTGIHIGGYGKDLDPPSSLVELLRRVEDQTEVPRLRLGSVEPTEIPAELLELMAESSRICPHLHIPLQSGDNQVLKRMNRHYTTQFFHELVRTAHNKMPEAAIGLDVIAGYPGESEDEFDHTCRLLENLPISHLHVFPYSRRPGTPAAEVADQLPGELIKSRAAMIRAIGERKNRQFCERFIGRVLEVVVEGGEMDGYSRGLSRNYLSIMFKSNPKLQGKRAWVKILGWKPDGLHGELI
ncbi:MAG TPA: tRNA (N(6)-L-threonylcarbamoyladenosine(37)-C(2))-methylthiotransferase MtaB [Geothermobacteraceae bacterium]|nr:tRNA (N(6)-L-threonylcarbamoyladenosine(37)-C(2))-methylthiotransferase MtaB [Geothermobacteraceae bacterium]